MSKVTGGKRKSPSKNVKKTVKKKKIDTPKNQHYNDEQDSMWEVECIVDKTYDDSDKLFYKVHWRGWPDEMDTWELAENLSGCKDLIKKFEKDKRNTGLYSVEKILGKRTNNNGTTEYRVKWLGYSEHSSTWEPEENILDKKLIENFDNEKEVDAIDMLYDADLVQLYSHKEYFLGHQEIVDTIRELPFLLQWDIIRHLQPFGTTEWDIFRREDVELLQKCKTIKDTTRLMKRIIPNQNPPTEMDEKLTPRIFRRPPHLMSRKDHSDYVFSAAAHANPGYPYPRIELKEVEQRLACRFWRKWGSHRFIHLTFHRKVSPDQISFLCETGIEIKQINRKYEFLFAKPLERQVIFFCVNADPPMSAHAIREWHCNIINNPKNYNINICKYNARISLGFSDSIPVAVIPFEETEIIDDVYGIEDEESSIMTDGCALISLAALNTIRENSRLQNTPCAVQGRYGSAKGVWILGDQETMGDRLLLSRKSQVKYDITPIDEYQQSFELLQYSRDMGSAHLNRQFIQVLEFLGISTEVFLEIQDDAVRSLSKTLTSSPESALRAVIGGIGGGGLEKEVCEYLMAGFDFKEPYIRLTITNLIKNRLKKMKEKASIKVFKSRYLLMVPDPTGLLKENEIFLQISGSDESEENGKMIGILTTKVIVTRTPCHLPSDIRLLRAVDYPQLRNMIDCVVLSVRGSASQASLMSGGDYDGDLAWVCWDERLVNIKQYTTPPKDYIKNDPSIENDPASEITVGTALGIGQPNSNFLNVKNLEKLMIQHFIRQSKNCKLGELTNLHHRWAESKGINNPTTIRLAELCALSVDSAKSGMIITMPKIDVPPWPHYMKNTKNFHSKLALGKLFDDISSENILDRCVGKWWKDKSKSGPHEPLQIDEDLVLSSIPPQFMDLAEGWMKEYNSRIRFFIQKTHDGRTRNYQIENLKKEMRTRFLDAEKSLPLSLLLASAIYKVTRTRDVKMKQEARNFPWIVCADRLIRIKADAVNKRLENQLAPTIINRYFSSIRMV